MAQRYEYHVHELPSAPSAIETLLNMEGEDGFELATLSFTEGTAIFQKDIYVERRSPEHIADVMRAVKSYGDISALSFVLTADNPLSDGPFPPREVEEDEALRFLIERILKES